MTDNLPSKTKAQIKLSQCVRLTLKVILYIVMILLSLILLLFCYLLYLGLEEAKLIYADTCGHYQFRVYQFDSGAGYMQLVNDKNKVIQEIKIDDDDLPWGPADWSKDCRSITVTAPEGITDMKVDK